MAYTDDRNLRALVTLLKRVDGCEVDYDIGNSNYNSLFSSLSETMETLVRDGYVGFTSVAEGVERQNASACKNFLKSKGFPVTGKKSDLVNRILSSFTEEELSDFARPGLCYRLTSMAKSVIERHTKVEKERHDLIFEHLLNRDSKKAVELWNDYQKTYSNPEIIAKSSIPAISRADRKTIALCDAYLSADYSDLQNSNDFRRKLAAAFAMVEIVSNGYCKWLSDYLSQKTDETIQCNELIRTSQECNNVKNDPNGSNSYSVDVLAIYHSTIRRLVTIDIEIAELKTTGVTTIKKVHCGKIGCFCPNKGIEPNAPIDKFALPPYKYGCDARLSYEW